MKHIISYSGGAGSFMAALRVIDKHGPENVQLVFTDTKTEDEDLYRFLDETTEFLGAEFVHLADGRSVWDVFFDEEFIGNTRVGNCTKALKQKIFRDWLEKNYGPEDCIVYLGFDWSEAHRMERAYKHWEPYTVKAPLCDEPFIDKEDIFKYLESINIKVPRLYKMGFSHNNCGGFCVKAGQGHYKMLLKEMPERYKYHEEMEQKWRKETGKDNAILRDRRGGTTKPMTLKDFRERIEKEIETEQLDLFDFGGCGCFID